MHTHPPTLVTQSWGRRQPLPVYTIIVRRLYIAGHNRSQITAISLPTVTIIMKVTFALLAIGFAVVTAISFKPDDTPKLKKEGKKFVSDDLGAFNDATHYLSPFFEKLLTYLKKAQTNNVKLTKNIKSVVDQMKGFVSGGVTKTASALLHTLTYGIDGNRDNVSYYVLHYSNEWIKVRLPAVNSVATHSALEKIQEDIVTARDNLDANAQVFVKGIQKIKELSYMFGGPKHEQEIIDIINNLEKGTNDTTLVVKTNAAVKGVKKLLSGSFD